MLANSPGPSGWVARVARFVGKPRRWAAIAFGLPSGGSPPRNRQRHGDPCEKWGLTMRQITAADILPAADYARQRKELRASIVAMKRLRRLQVGPYATLHFENFDTMRMQVQEMLHIEKG